VPDLAPITPLGNAQPITEQHGPVTLSEVVDRAYASVAARLNTGPDAMASLAYFLGTPLPDVEQISGTTQLAFWMGPDQWMIIADFVTHETIAAELAQQAQGNFSVTEQTDAWCRFDLSGAQLADVFERLCPVNVRAKSNGTAVRTTIDHLGCFVLIFDPNHIAVMGPRSAAGSLHHALVTALRSVF